MKKTLRIRVLLGLGVSIVGFILINGCITPKPIEATPVATGMINLDTSSGYTPRIGDCYRFEVRWTTTRFDPLPYCWELLDSIAAFLRFHPNAVCEIGVHTDFRASMEFNDTLSYKRAKNLTNYIIAKGVDPTRIIPVGYGERVPRILDKDYDVPEFKSTLPKGAHLTEAFINQLKTNNQKEAAHSLNRRAELVVIGWI